MYLTKQGNVGIRMKKLQSPKMWSVNLQFGKKKQRFN